MPAIPFVSAKASTRRQSLIDGGVLSAADAAFIQSSQSTDATSTVTLAELNAGKVIVPAIAGVTFRVTEILAIFTGTFLTATDIRISDTAATPVDVAVIPIASATNGAKVTAGRNFAPLTVGQGIQVRKTGSAATGGTSIFVQVFYQMG